METGIAELSLGEQARLLDALAEAAFQIGNNSEARRLCEELSRHPDHQSDLRLRLFLFDLALQAKPVDRAGIEKALENIRSVERTNGPFYRYGQALRLLWQARNNEKPMSEAVREADAHLVRVAQMRPDWPQVSLARAEMFELAGQQSGSDQGTHPGRRTR